MPENTSIPPESCAGCAGGDASLAAEARTRRLAVVFVALLALIMACKAFLPDWLRDDKFRDDLCQHVWWTCRFTDPELFPGDVAAAFFSRPIFAPYGYQALYRALAPWVNAQALAETIPLALTAAVAVLAFLLGQRAAGGALLGGVVAATWALTRKPLALLKGGLPRTFALPVLMLGVWALMARRYGWLGVSFLLAALFYPQLFVTLGLLSAVVIGVRLFRERRLPAGWPSLVAMGLVATALLLAVYGGPLPEGIGPKTTMAEALSMPEFGPGGRSEFFSGSATDFYLTRDRSGLVSGWGWEFLAGLVLIIVGAVAFRGAVGLETWALAGAALAAFGLAHATLFAMHLPNRYVRFALPVFFMLGLAAVVPRALAALLRARWAGRVSAWLKRPAMLWMLAAAVLAVCAGDAVRRIQSQLREPVAHDLEKAYAFLAALPKDTLVAAFPQDADAIPLRTRRSVLASKEESLPYYLGYYRMMSERVDAELAAFFASDWRTVDVLGGRYGVDVFLVNRARYRNPAASLYYHPFTEENRKRVARGQRDGFVLANPPPDRILFQTGDYAVVRVGPAK